MVCRSGGNIRPMKDRTREALFNVLGPIEPGTGVIDLFAGTGVVAFEAISRGAERAIAVERHRATAGRIVEHARRLGIAPQVEVSCMDVFDWWRRSDRDFLRDVSTWLVFCCPPYDLFVERPEAIAGLVKDLFEASPSESRFVVESDDRFDGTRWLGPNWTSRRYRPAVIWLKTSG